jgi:hypothetical protein
MFEEAFGVKVVIQNGFKWSISSGTIILIWDPNWIRNEYVIPQPTVMNPAMDNPLVADLFISNTKNWHMENISLLFDDVLAYHISSTPLLASVQHDRFDWKFEKNGVDLTNIASRNPNTHQHIINGEWHQIWCTKTPPRYGGLRVGVYPPGRVFKQEVSIVLPIVPFAMKIKTIYMCC